VPQALTVQLARLVRRVLSGLQAQLVLTAQRVQLALPALPVLPVLPAPPVLMARLVPMVPTVRLALRALMARLAPTEPMVPMVRPVQPVRLVPRARLARLVRNSSFGRLLATRTIRKGAHRGALRFDMHASPPRRGDGYSEVSVP
jgi:hypothetical protein